MKLLKLSAALIAAAVSSASIAAPYTGSLAGASSDGTNLQGSVALAIVATEEFANALQISQFGSGDSCVGDRGIACMPSVSSAELRAMIYKTIADMDEMISDDQTVGVNIHDYISAGGNQAVTEAQANGNAVEHVDNGTNIGARVYNVGYSSDAVDGLSQFIGAATTVDGVSCGGNSQLPAAAGCSGDAATTLACVTASANARVNIAFVPASELDGVGTDVGFIKLDGQAPTLANWMEGDYALGQNIIGTPSGGMPADGTTPFGTVGVESSVSNSTLRHQTGAGSVAACAPLTTGVDGLL